MRRRVLAGPPAVVRAPALTASRRRCGRLGPMAAAPTPDGRLPVPIARAARRAAAAALLVFAVLVSEGSLAGLTRRGPFTSDFFDAQAHALVDGRLDVDPQVAGIEGFVHDGRTQLYFGLVPSLLRVPVAAVTTELDGRLTQASMLLALAVALWATARLVWRARRHWHGADPPAPWEAWVVAGFVAAVGLASPLLFLAARPVVYHEAELWGTATGLVALEALLAWWERPEVRRLVLASLAAGAALHTRGSVGSGAVAALGCAALVALTTRHVPRRAVWGLAVAVLAPVVTYAAVNQARFGDPVRIPFRDQVLSSFDPARQATLEATDGSLFGPEFAPTALVTYLRPDGVRLQALFPWVTFRESTAVLGDATFDTVDRSASLPVVAPSLVVLAAVGAVSMIRRPRRWPWLAAAAGTATGLVSTVTIAFIANRYLSDFTPLLVLLAAPGAWTLAGWVRAQGPVTRRAAVAGGLVLSLAGALVSVALALQAQRLFILPATGARHDLVSFQYDLHERLGGGRPPHVRAVETVGTPGQRGEVALLDECRGLYWSDGVRWWPLELGGPDGLVVTPSLRDGRSGTPLLSGDGWRVRAMALGPDTARLEYRADGEPALEGPVVGREVIDDGTLTVWLDPASSELTVTAGGRELLVAWLVDLHSPVAPAPGLSARPAPTPLCHELAARLEG